MMSHQNKVIHYNPLSLKPFSILLILSLASHRKFVFTHLIYVPGNRTPISNKKNLTDDDDQQNSTTHFGFLMIDNMFSFCLCLFRCVRRSPFHLMQITLTPIKLEINVCVCVSVWYIFVVATFSHTHPRRAGKSNFDIRTTTQGLTRDSLTIAWYIYSIYIYCLVLCCSP